MDPTKKEKNAINTLKRLAKRWPESLWLFADGNGLHVMRSDIDGKHIICDNGAMDPDCILDTIDIENDGGDW